MSVAPSPHLYNWASARTREHLEETAPMLSVTRETKAVLKTKTGERVVAFTKDSEPGIASLAIPGDRAKLSPREMRELAAWLNETAAEQEKVTRDAAKTSLTFNGTRYERRAMSPQERAYQDLIARGLRP